MSETPPAAPFDDQAARRLRRLWFDFLAVVEPLRPDLHSYCLKLTGNLWNAEDLSQDTLLRAFAVIGRGDLHGAGSRVSNARAYLFRTASNTWIDQVRRRRRERPPPPAPDIAPAAEASAQLPDAAQALFSAAPQERAALVLKEVFGFDLAEIAEILDTTPGAVKSALHRARARLGAAPTAEPPASRGVPASRALVDRFVEAFKARDPAALTALLLQGVEIEVMGVGGERGHGAIWIENAPVFARGPSEPVEIDGALAVAHFADLQDGRRLASLTRLEEVDGLVSRIRSYPFSRETLAEVAARLGLDPLDWPYHQDPETLLRMVGGTGLPWIDGA